jgi:TetR/AcrR family tetracycline transcriptional repressor
VTVTADELEPRVTTRGRGAGSGQVRALDVDEILLVARAILATQGVEGLTMRALARQLGVSPMAAYHHVGNKDDLLALIIDDALRAVEVPQASSGAWDERLKALNRSASSVVASCPRLDEIAFTTRPTTEGWRLINAYIQIMLDGGLAPREALLGFSLIHSYGMGRANMEREIRHSRPDGLAAPKDFPAVQHTWSDWSELRKPDFREFAIDVIIAGLKAITQGRSNSAEVVGTPARRVRGSALGRTASNR